MPRLNAFLLMILVSVVIACTQGKPPQSQAWSAATGAEAFERLWWKAVQDHDFKTAERHLAPIYTLVTPAGIQDRQQALRYFQELDLTSINLAEVQVKPEGSNMVVSYVATVQRKAATSPKRIYMVTVWQEVKSGWIAIAHTETPEG